MNCINLKQKLNKKIFCKNKNKEILLSECSNCKFKEFKKNIYKRKIKKVSKRTKALAIPTKIKKIVWERDNHRCIFCHCKVPWNCANSHFIKRSQGGLGIEENIITNCPDCHHDFDDSVARQDMLAYARDYLQSKYEDWNEDDLIYKKYSWK